MKNLTSSSICSTQKTFEYHFCIHYYQVNPHCATDTLLQYPQWKAEKKAIFWTKNTKILYKPLSSLPLISGRVIDNIFLLYQILISKIALMFMLYAFGKVFL